MEIEETKLPGIGLRHDVVTRQGRRMAVVSQRNGVRELVVYDQDDPDASAAVIALTGEEAEVVAELLGAPRVVERLGRLQEQVEGMASHAVPVLPGSPFVGRTLGETQARTRTGASIIAIVRDQETLPSPGPECVFEAGDRVVVIGTDAGVHAVEQILAEG